jgi:hypothetical protein
VITDKMVPWLYNRKTRTTTMLMTVKMNVMSLASGLRA